MSTDLCLGTSDVIDRFEAGQVKILNHKKVLDVGCGDRFTVVIATDNTIKLPSLAMQNFNQKNFSQIKNKVKLLKEFSKKKQELNNRPESIIAPPEVDLKKIGLRKRSTFDGHNYDLKFEEANQRLLTDSIVDEKKKGSSVFEGSSSYIKTNPQENLKQNDVFLDISQKLLTEIKEIKKLEELGGSDERIESPKNKMPDVEISDERGK